MSRPRKGYLRVSARHGAAGGGKRINNTNKGLYMRKRRVRIVADSCPIKKKNCDPCRYSYGTENGKVYCYYGDSEAKNKA